MRESEMQIQRFLEGHIEQQGECSCVSAAAAKLWCTFTYQVGVVIVVVVRPRRDELLKVLRGSQ